MAELIRQTDEVRQRFRQAISQSERQRRGAAVSRMEERHPVIGSLLAPLAHLVLLDEDLRNWGKGQNGETKVARMLKRLPSPWCYMNDVVLERRPGEYMQVDHIAIGESCVAVIETKNWRGAIQGLRDVWKIKSKGVWHKVASSPSHQTAWHARAIRDHLSAMGYNIQVVAALVFIDPDWLRVTECGCPVFSDTRALRDHLLSIDMESGATPASCREVGETIAATFALRNVKAEPPHDVRQSQGEQQRKLVGEVATVQTDMPADPATQKQRDYVATLLTRADMKPSATRIDTLTKAEAQAVIDRLRFHREVPMPDGLTDDQ